MHWKCNIFINSIENLGTLSFFTVNLSNYFIIYSTRVRSCPPTVLPVCYLCTCLTTKEPSELCTVTLFFLSNINLHPGCIVYAWIRVKTELPLLHPILAFVTLRNLPPKFFFHIVFAVKNPIKYASKRGLCLCSLFIIRIVLWMKKNVYLT